MNDKSECNQHKNNKTKTSNISINQQINKTYKKKLLQILIIKIQTLKHKLSDKTILSWDCPSQQRRRKKHLKFKSHKKRKQTEKEKQVTAKIEENLDQLQEK